MNFLNKTLVAAAVAVSCGTVSAANVTSFNLVDFDNDGLASDFNFFTPPTGNGPNTFTGDVNGGSIALGAENAAGSFSTGFNFGGTGQFVPFVANAAGTGSIVADIDGAGALTFSSLDFGGTFGTNFYLAPDDINAVSSTTTLLNPNEYGVVVTFASTINDSTSPFNGFVANWRLEGIMSNATSAVPVPAAAWLFGSGLLGLVGVARRRKAA